MRTIEDEVELQRQKKLEELRSSNLQGTPVTAESFAAWKERKKILKLEAAKKLVEAEFRKKKGGKGLSVLSGRDLYEFKRDLFKDDENAEAVIERESLENELNQSDPLQTVAEQVQTSLFLDGDDSDLDELLEESDIEESDLDESDYDDDLEEDEDDIDEEDVLSKDSNLLLPN